MNAAVMIAERILNPSAGSGESDYILAIRASAAALTDLRAERQAIVTAKRGTIPRVGFDVAQSDLQLVDAAIRETNRALALALRLDF